jgi:hypothetical protein
MLRYKLCPALVVIASTLAANGCSTVTDPGAPEDEPGIIERLEDMGFEPAQAIAAGTGPDGRTGTVYSHTDGRFALLVSDELGDEVDGFVFDRTGELQSRLAPASEVSYCLSCSAAYWACYGACAPGCWSENGFGQGCHADCNAACTWYYEKICIPNVCPTTDQ